MSAKTYCLVVIVTKIVSLVYISLICLYLWPLPTMFRIINIQYYLVFICSDDCKTVNTTLSRTDKVPMVVWLPSSEIYVHNSLEVFRPLVVVAALEFHHY